MARGASVIAITSSEVHPGANSVKVRPSGVTRTTAMSVMIVSTQTTPSMGKEEWDTRLEEPSSPVWGIMAMTRRAPPAQSTAAPGECSGAVAAVVQWVKSPRWVTLAG